MQASASVDVTRFIEDVTETRKRADAVMGQWEDDTDVGSPGGKASAVDLAILEDTQTVILFGEPGQGAETSRATVRMYDRGESLIQQTYPQLSAFSRSKRSTDQNTLVAPRVPEKSRNVSGAGCILVFELDKTVALGESRVDLGKERIVCTELNTLQDMRDAVFLRCDRIQRRARHKGMDDTWENEFYSGLGAWIIKDVLYWESGKSMSYYEEICKQNRLRRSPEPMSKYLLRDLPWTLNGTFVFVHSGLCTHEVSLQFVRARDEEDPDVYPYLSFLSPERDMRCRICRDRVPTVVVSHEYRLAGESPYVACNECFWLCFGRRDERRAVASHGELPAFAAMSDRASALGIHVDPYRVV